MFLRIILSVVVLLVTLHGAAVAEQEKTVIYKSEMTAGNSLPELLLASFQQPDLIELPLVLTRDGSPLVFDDIRLNPKTNVAEIFPERSRQDNNFYVVDFTLAEIRQLSYTASNNSMEIAGHLASLAEVMQMTDRLNAVRSSSVGILALIKYPWFHSNEGYDISNSVLKTLLAHSSLSDTRLLLKCYDPDELQRIKKELIPGLPVQVTLMQGVDSKQGNETMRLRGGRWVGYDYEWLFTRLGLRVVSGYADVLILQDIEQISPTPLASLIGDSQALKMRVFLDTAGLPRGEEESYYERLLFELNGDGLITGMPGKLRSFLESKKPVELDSSDLIQPQPTTEEDPPALLSDPEALIERLKKIQE